MGKRRLESALLAARASRPDLAFDVRWRPFELDSSLPRGKGHDKLDHYNRKFGPEAVASMVPRMRAVAREHGIEMEYGGHVGNTFDSHRLIWAAREEGGSDLQDKVVEELFKAYFERNESLGERDVLKRCAAAAGMEGGDALLGDDERGTDEVRREVREYGRAYGCRGVPMFVIDGKYALNGAQEPDAFLRAFDRL